MLINLAYVCREFLVPILRFPFRLRSALFVACLAALFAPGCSSADDCSQGETRCDGNRTRAARVLGVSVRTLRNKIRQYSADGIDVPVHSD